MMIPERYKRKEANPMDVSRSLFFDADQDLAELTRTQVFECKRE
jgi:hypothetical protein